MADTVEKNPLIYLYRSLEKADSRRLGKWLDSPIHNQRDDVRALHAYLVGSEGRLLKTNALSKTRIWKRLFPQEDFDDARLRQTFHWALKATESFLAYERWREAPINEQLALISSLRTYQDPSHIERALKKADQLQDQDPLKNETFFRNQYQLELERDEYRSYHKLLDKPNFQQIADNLDLAYLIEKLKVSCNILYQRRMSRQEFSLNFLPEVISRVEAYDLKAYPTLAIYYYVYRGLTEEDVRGTHTALLRDTLAEYEQLLSKPDLRYVILMAINLCITHMNQGHEAYAREAFEWYKLGLHQDVIAENGLLTRTTYLNIVSNAIKLREYAWTEDFIQGYTHQLEDDIRENTERFARARLGYEQKDYGTVMPLLVQVDFKHPVYNLLAKTLLLKIYYELEEFDALESQVDSMITYIRRKKLSDLHRDNFTNVARLVRQLSRIPPRDQAKLQELILKIEQTTPLNDKQWLLEQARGLQS